ncbi:MAG: ATP-dependent DNA helicase RecG [Acidobacteriota bacterium]|nr:ATP-dependent DNA helicase RecG [Acidobacteriota bacterium]
MADLQTEVQFLKGVGPRLAETLAAKGIHTLQDLLYYLPFRYEDRINPRSIEQLQPGEMASVIAEVRSSGLFRTRKMPIFELVAGQGRTRLKCLWFRGGYLEGRFKPGALVALYGKVEFSTFGRGGLQMLQPQFEILHEPPAEGDLPLEGEEQQHFDSLEVGRIVPIYEAAGKLNARWFRRAIRRALESMPPEIGDAIPAAIREHLSLIPRGQAFWQAHWPDAGESFADLQAARTPAHRRLIFEELFFLELGLELKRRKARLQPGIGFKLDEKVRKALKKVLPFHPTAAQKKVLKEIVADMQHPSPMRRLLQGDVGSGKTIVAFEAATVAMQNGYQVALMAPTEILATQHYLSARQILEPAGYRVVLLTGGLDPQQKRGVRRHVASGDAQLVIGTHALLEDNVEFDRLGLVVMDEQHRFGVLQRMKLMRKNSDVQPDVLVMTATPIPRTLALTLYGDLDISVIDELPPGRTPVSTRVLDDTRSEEVWEFVRKILAQGQQAYIVYPVIEENEEKDTGLKAAIKMYNELRKKVFPEFPLGLLHGRMSAEEKEDTMRRFKSGELKLLISTTVIEVGVDVPNASVMVIEHAERFGLSQLHQLRGRIGRGAAKSYCILMTGGKVGEDAAQRLDTMVQTNDGFQVAEKDLELRGPGEFFGSRQAGMPSLRVANLVRDRELLELAKREARALINGETKGIPDEEKRAAAEYLKANWNRRYGLVEVG